MTESSNDVQGFPCRPGDPSAGAVSDSSARPGDVPKTSLSANVANGEPRVVWKRAGNEISVPINEEVIKHPKVLYMYFDESGNLDFGPNGTSHLIITCVVTKRPFVQADRARDYKMDLMEQGVDIEHFHACKDSRDTRLGLYKILECGGYDMRVYSVFVEKGKVPEDSRDEAEIYAKLFELLVKEIFESEHGNDLELVVAITDRLPVASKRSKLAKPFKHCMKAQFQERGTPYRLFHRSSCSDMNLQITDYFCWAVQRDVVSGKDWPLRIIKRFVRELGEVEYG